MNKPLIVETSVQAPLEKTWKSFTETEHITQWNHASDDWVSPRAENDLRKGGRFTYRMEAADGSEGFDFTGTYDEVVPHERISYTMDDGRRVEVTFLTEGDYTRVVTKFDPETENPLEFQRAGWQAILDNFKTYTEEVSL